MPARKWKSAMRKVAALPPCRKTVLQKQPVWPGKVMSLYWYLEAPVSFIQESAGEMLIRRKSIHAVKAMTGMN